MRLDNKKLLLPLAISMALYGTHAIADDDTENNVVTVTAQKRVERLEEVPISMSVFPQEEIDQTGIQELRELAGQIPNLTISQGTDFGAKILIRGVGSNTRNIAFDSRVGVYLDGVYLGQGPALNQDLVDLEQVEVLRGPQGSLFGKNTIAGAISLVSQKPHDELEGKFTVNAGNYNALEVKGSVNIPFSEALSGKFAFSNRTRDGYITNTFDSSMVPTTMNVMHPVYGLLNLPLCDQLGGTSPAGCVAGPVGANTEPDTSKKFNNQDTQSWRAQVRLQPNDKLDINIAFDGLSSDRIPMLAIPQTETFGSGLDYVSPDPYEVAYSHNGDETREIFGANMTIDYDMDNGYALRSITSYRETELVYFSDTDASVIDFLTVTYADDYKQKTQEFQLISPDDRAFKYVVGAYFYDQSAFADHDADAGNAGFFFGIAPGGGAFYEADVDTSSSAVFMSGSIDFNEQWKLGFGFRYSEETKDLDWALQGAYSGAFMIGSTATGGMQSSRTDRQFSPTLSMNYALNDETQLYAKYSTGFKSGGYNLDYIIQTDLDAGIEFDVETAISYEFGYKANLLENRMSLNIALFSIEYDDYQVNQFFDLGFDPVTGTQLTSIRISNAAKVITDGAEVEMKFRMTDDFTVTGSLGFLDATFDDFPGGYSVLSEPSDPDSAKESVNAAGNKLPMAADFNATLGLQYYTRIDSLGGDLLMRLDVNHTGDYYTSIENIKSLDISGLHGVIFSLDLPHYGIPATIDWGYVEANTTMSGRVGLISDGAWEVYLWGRNLTDENQFIDSTREFFGARQFVPQTPRTYGVEMIYNF
ncbi:MAG: TonB-dependent receptor [Gammaproteobacteria bacterium]|nr:TonB-dependent receptor [Gammaproteobacteria bacterium]